jgi:Xaa-Pro dipeptidase
MWAKLDQPGAVYYDITWTAFCGATPTEAMRNVFAAVTGARDAAIERVQDAIAAGTRCAASEVDDACARIHRERGFGEYFTHRTGHSIGQEVHGNGANMDNFETHDERRVTPWTCFSSSRASTCRSSACAPRSTCSWATARRVVTGEIQREWRCSDADHAQHVSFPPHAGRVPARV